MYQQQEGKEYENPGLTSKGIVNFQLRLSDQLKHFYNPKSNRLNFQLRSQPIKRATLFQKQLDKPLQWYKKTFAFLAGVKTLHQFLIFELQSGIYGSLDFYIDNRVLLRLGNLDTIIESNTEGKRKESTAVSKNQVPYSIQMGKIQNGLNFGQLMSIMYEILPADGYKQIKFNGSHFSRAMMAELRKQKKGQGSLIRYKLVQPIIGFKLI